VELSRQWFLHTAPVILVQRKSSTEFYIKDYIISSPPSSKRVTEFNTQFRAGFKTGTERSIPNE